MLENQMICRLLEAHANQTPNAVAIGAPDRTPLTYGHLHQHMQHVVQHLNALGIGRHDRVAIVLPNGPEMAVAFLAVAAAATSAPLNPAYRQQEFDFYLSDLAAKALLVVQGADSSAIAAAQARDIPVIELTPLVAEAAGLFTLSGRPRPLTGPASLAQPDDVALMLHTSGTTARPKIVPLTHRNLCASAANIGQALQLTSEDRGLNIMPLFHIHGLIAALLASLAAGASVVCTSGFDAPRFFDCLVADEPTWYTAVPTMHQAILARADQHRDVIAQTSLRFIRSSSSPLRPGVMSELETLFNVPVIEAYGMTEAAHQIASNPLPPQPTKSGSVGPAAGPEMAVMAEVGETLLPSGVIGEIVIRGANVTLGYADNPEANALAFTNGWFRTGDQGYRDEAGYFYITGRLKEIINRGGQKISPCEVDNVLLDHPAIAQALTFAIPDKQLGEEIAAAVVLKDQAVLTEAAIRRFAATCLADYKVPRRVVILEEIPQGPTGKLQRIGLADQLGLAGAQEAEERSPTAFVAPRTEVEVLLAELWQAVLGLDRIGIHHPFLGLGGDSVLAAQLVARVRQTCELDLSIIDFFEAPTIAEQSVIVERLLLQEIESLTDEAARRLTE